MRIEDIVGGNRSGIAQAPALAAEMTTTAAQVPADPSGAQAIANVRAEMAASPSPQPPCRRRPA